MPDRVSLCVSLLYTNYHARIYAEGPQAMVRGAVIYGGLVYMLSGGLRSKKEPFEYQEQPLEF